MPKNIGTEIAAIERRLTELTPTNRLLLAYQFEQAKVKHGDGFTMDVFGQLYTAERGYAVAVTRDSFKSLADALDTMDRVQKWGFRNVYLGYWCDAGQEYVDVSLVTSSWEMAEQLGRKWEQKAVWSFKDDRAIRLDAGE